MIRLKNINSRRNQFVNGRSVQRIKYNKPILDIKSWKPNMINGNPEGAFLRP